MGSRLSLTHVLMLKRLTGVTQAGFSTSSTAAAFLSFKSALSSSSLHALQSPVTSSFTIRHQVIGSNSRRLTPQNSLFDSSLSLLIRESSSSSSSSADHITMDQSNLQTDNVTHDANINCQEDSGMSSRGLKASTVCPSDVETPVMFEPKEVRFPVSWGHISAKEWGDPLGHPVLMIHGWLDNAGSFDPIIPHLLSVHNLHIVAVDEPGCGLSSHKPPGSDYNRWAHLRELKRIVDQLNWTEVTLVGHSLGAAYSFLMACIYPDLVKRVIAIDVPKPLTAFSDNWASRVPKAIEKHIEYDKLFMRDPTLESTAPVYSEEKALQKMMEAHGNSLTEASARIMMKRGAKPLRDGYTFTRDIRQKLPSLDPSPTEETMIKFISRLRADLLVIRAKQGVYQVPESMRKKYYDIYERNCKIFRDVLLDGTHHLHMNTPEKVAPAINDFLSDSFKLQSGFSYPKSSL